MVVVDVALMLHVAFLIFSSAPNSPLSALSALFLGLLLLWVRHGMSHQLHLLIHLAFLGCVFYKTAVLTSAVSKACS